MTKPNSQVNVVAMTCVNTLNIIQTDTCNRITAGVYIIKSLQPGLKNKNNQTKSLNFFSFNLAFSIFTR